jgi:hypothetical protein
LTRPFIVLLLVLTVLSTGSVPARPAPAPKSTALPADLDVKLMLIYVNGKPVGVSPIVRKQGDPLCPVRMAQLLKFKVSYVEGARIATLTKPSGETAVFKVGVKVAVVKTRAGKQRLVQMPLAPIILTARIQRASDHMWIPLQTVVDMAGGKMLSEGRKIHITL